MVKLNERNKRMVCVYRAEDVLEATIQWSLQATFSTFTDAIEYLLKKVREEEKQGLIPTIK